MHGVWSTVAVAPVVGVALMAVALRPRLDVAAARRLAVVRAALTVGAFAVVTVEVAGAWDGLAAPVMGASWLGFVLAAGVLAWLRVRRQGWSPATAGRRLSADGGASWSAMDRGERLMVVTVGGVLVADLVVALLAEPNNFDSQTYHLPRVEHWVAQRDLQFWPTAIHRQLTIPPGAEYLLLHLRLLSGGDALHNLLQGAAGLGCLLLASRIVAQLGGGRRAQLVAVFLLATTPMVVLQATSTQTDLVTAAWTACVATLVLDGVRRRATAGDVLALGVAVGLTAVTKTSGLLAVGPLVVLWTAAQAQLACRSDTKASVRAAVSAVLAAGAALVAVVLIAGVLIAPLLTRVTTAFGHPLGPPPLRKSVPMQRHDPAAVLVNGLRICHTALDTPVGPVREVTAAGITRLASTLGVDPQDRATTFGRTTFPVAAWYPDEDRAAYPVAGGACLLALAAAMWRPARLTPHRAGTLRAYTAALLAALALYAATVKWQPWGNRLLLFALVLAAPIAGLWLDMLLCRHATTARRRASRSVVCAVLVTSALAGVLAVSYGFPRRLVGYGSVFTTDPWDTRFLRRPGWADDFRWAAASVTTVDPQRIGLVQQNDNWEYPWWLLLPERELVALQSVLPDQPPADPASVDAIICTGSQRACRLLVPDGWTLTWHGYVGWARPA